MLLINKVDRLIKELQLTPEKMQERFINIINNVNRIIKEIAPKEYGDKWQVSVQEGTVAFGSAFNNWALSWSYMQKTGLTFKDVIDAYKSEDKSKIKELAKKAPLHKVILNMSIRHHPNPVEAQKYRIPKIWHGDLESEEGKSLLDCNHDGPLFFVATKIVIDPQAGEITGGRLFSGTIKKGVDVYLNGGKQNYKIHKIFIFFLYQ